MQYIKIDNLYFSYGKKIPVLNGFSLTVKENGIYLLLGKNGSGKTTFMKILIKFLHYEKGSIRIKGKELNKLDLGEVSRTVSFLESEIPSIPLSAEEIIGWGFYPYGGKGNVVEIAEILNLGRMLKKNFNELSTGEKKRVLLGRVFAQQSEIVLIDEPFNFLDPRYKIEIALMLKKLGENRVVIISTHNLNIAQFIGKEIFLLGNGRILAVKNKENLFSDNIIMNIFEVTGSLRANFKDFYKINNT